MTTVDSAKLGKAIRVVDAPGRYIEFCKSTVSTDVNLNGLKIVVDCANGAAYHIAPNVFRELGADVIEVGVEPNGLNINLDCGATYPATLQHCVLHEQADLGIALDGDGDRVIMVDHQGEVLDGDDLLYIIAIHRHQLGILKGGVVGTVMTNRGLENALQALAVPFCRVPVGDRHIIAELHQRQWHLGGEPSGHVVCFDALSTGDGIISALQVLSALRYQKKSLNDLKSGLHKYPQILLNVKVPAVCDLESKQLIQQCLQGIVRKLGNKGRVSLRCSGTEPLVRVMVEGENKNDITELAHQLVAVVQKELC